MAEHDVRSGASCPCDERTPKLLPNERSIETDSPTDLEWPCAREPRLEQTVPSSVVPALRTKREKQGWRKGAWPRVVSRKVAQWENLLVLAPCSDPKSPADDLFAWLHGVSTSISLIVSHLDQSLGGGRSSPGSPAGSCRTTPATWSTPRRGACSVPRDHPTPAPGSPARRRAAEVKMVEYITIAHGSAQRISEKWRHVACTSVLITFCTSPFCVGVGSGARRSGCPPRHLPVLSLNSTPRVRPVRSPGCIGRGTQHGFWSVPSW